ncbi:hypothetical protein Z946_212 [Sulfitobacter noctilucicola]|nr:hypothetical protein Z946_212 [Sulfitobacter noctilucicola]
MHAAALPFVMPWKTLAPALEVVSVDPASDVLWARLLEGQGIPLKTGSGPLPQDCAVITGFGRLESGTPHTLASFVAQATQALRPGGLLVLGRAPRHQMQDGDTGITPADAIRILKDAGFARLRMIHPAPPPPDDTGFCATMDSRDTCLIVAQTQAYGKAFDVFSPVFCTTPVAPEPDYMVHLKQAQAAWHDRLHHVESSLQDRINVLNDRLSHSTQEMQHTLEERIRAATEAQAADIAELRGTITRLERLTRRRGLRKLFYKLKQKARAKSAQAAPSGMQSDVQLQDVPPPAQTVQAIDTPVHEVDMHPADPVPLSPREAQMQDRLFGTGAT